MRQEEYRRLEEISPPDAEPPQAHASEKSPEQHLFPDSPQHHTERDTD